MTSPETRDHKTRRIEHPTTEEIKEIDIKWNIMKIIEELKQEVNNCHKEIEMTNKMQRKWINLPKIPKKNKKKQSNR